MKSAVLGYEKHLIMSKQSHSDNKQEKDILTPEEVARYLKKSKSWVYKNWQKLGGKKLGGSLFFPRKEDLYERLFGKKVQAREEQVQNKKRGKRQGLKKKGRDTASESLDPNRHGLLDPE